MAADVITYLDKVAVDGKPNNPSNWVDVNANEVKDAVNNHAGLLDGLETDKADASDLTAHEADVANPHVVKEEQVDGTSAEDLTLTGAENISLADNVDMYLKLTGNAVITFTDTPSVGFSIVRSYTVESSVAETLGIANSTDEFGEYAADTTINEMVVKASNYATEGLIIRVFFSQPE
jgi:hypothetical protein